MIKTMLVEDEEKTRKLLAILIMELNMGFEVVAEADSGIKALELLNTVSVDVILTDIKMPLMDGITFAEKALQYNPDCKIIIVTAYDDFEYARKAIRIGVSDFILKPLKRAEIADALRRLTGEQASTSGSKEELKLVDKVEEYIKNNIGDEQLSLLTLAQAFYVNPTYLSRRFKQERNFNLSEYLFKERMERALVYFDHTQMKAYEVGERVGISDPKYFGKCFKKYTGVSIQEYRRK